MIARVGNQEILHDDDLYVWLGGLKRWGAEAMVHAVLAVVDEAFTYLDNSPWIHDCARPLLDSARSWAALPNESNARKAFDEAKRAEELACKAGQLTTAQGDWWSYEIVEMCGLIPEAIALEAKLRKPDRDIPGPPEEDLADICRYFSVHPTRYKSGEDQTRQLVSKAIIEWLLKKPSQP